MKGATLHHLEVPRSARYALLGQPGPHVREVWVVLHGYRQLGPRFIRRFARVARPWRLICAPDALNRFYVGDAPGRHGPDAQVGGTWMTREDRVTEIGDYVRYLDLLHAHLQGLLPEPVPTVALGFSQGCHTLARWAGYGTARPATVVLWGETLPPDLDLSRARAGFAGARLWSVQGREDTHITADLLSREEAQMAEMGVSVERRWHPLGHVVEPETLDALAEDLSGDVGNGGPGNPG